MKAFISQVGLQSMEEAIHHTVPIVGIPFFADQEMNAKKVAMRGIGKQLSIETLTKKQLKDTVSEVINNPQ